MKTLQEVKDFQSEQEVETLKWRDQEHKPATFKYLQIEQGTRHQGLSQRWIDLKQLRRRKTQHLKRER